jgi:hypothetical protein
MFTMRRIFFIRQYVQPYLSKNPKYTFYTIKSSLTLAYYVTVNLTLIQGKYLRKKKKYVSFNVTTKIIKCQLFSLNIVCSIFVFHKAGNFTPEMFNVIYGN